MAPGDRRGRGWRERRRRRYRPAGHGGGTSAGGGVASGGGGRTAGPQPCPNPLLGPPSPPLSSSSSSPPTDHFHINHGNRLQHDPNINTLTPPHSTPDTCPTCTSSTSNNSNADQAPPDPSPRPWRRAWLHLPVITTLILLSPLAAPVYCSSQHPGRIPPAPGTDSSPALEWTWHLAGLPDRPPGASTRIEDSLGHRRAPRHTGRRPDQEPEILEWGPWGRATSCTRTCGTGVRYRRRACYSRRNGETELMQNTSICNGLDRQYEACKIRVCESDVDNFRALQCAVFNRRPYRGQYLRWRPYRRKPGHTHPHNLNPCSLICCADAFGGRHFAVRFSSKVIDGTRCDINQTGSTDGICINGTCAPIGCDDRLYSSLAFDHCGVCGGDNTTCESFSGTVTKHVNMGYTDMITIPGGARHIRAIETIETGAVFAVRNEGGILFVNGRSSTAYPTIYRGIGGTTFQYHHSLYAPDGLERLVADGPTNETLYVMMMEPEPEGRVTVSYEYTLPALEPRRLEHGLHVAPPVGGSLVYESPPLTTEEPRFVPDVHRPGKEPLFNIGLQQHRTSEQTQDKQRRGGGTREPPLPSTVTSGTDADDKVNTVNTTDATFPDSDVGYPGESVPANVGNKYRNPETNTGQFRYFWKTNDLAPCSATCTTGVQSSFAQCYRSDNVAVDNSYCEGSDKPEPAHTVCTGRPCSPRWVTSQWSSCSVSCGQGQQYRTVHCWRMMAPGFDSTVHDFLCTSMLKPVLVRACKEAECGPLWETSEWGECSRKCGKGVQTRNVRCSSAMLSCDDGTKPILSRACNLGQCVHNWVVSDWSECSGMCGPGRRRRSVTCRDSDGNFLHDKFCDQHTRPLSVQACSTNASVCSPVWVPQDWGVCSVDCNWGVTKRDVVCGSVLGGKFVAHDDADCRDQTVPSTNAACREPPCKARWHTTDWSQCSKSCGEGGVRVRTVQCYHDNKPSRHCPVDMKPPTTDVCEHAPCEEPARTPW